jgi:hypothetical protein
MKIKLTEKRVEALIAKVPAKDRVDYWDLLLPKIAGHQKGRTDLHGRQPVWRRTIPPARGR